MYYNGTFLKNIKVLIQNKAAKEEQSYNHYWMQQKTKENEQLNIEYFLKIMGQTI